jgi:hypothetical protein
MTMPTALSPKSLLTLLALLGLTLAAPSQAQAGAWSKNFGELYTKVGADFYKAARYVDPNTGLEVEGLDFFGQQYSLYAEVGVLPWWPLQVSLLLPLSVGTSRFPDETVFAEGDTGRATSVRLGDMRVQLQTSILRKGFQLSPAFELKIPLYGNGKVGSHFGTWSEAFPLPGDGQLDVTGWLFFGGALPKTPMFLQGGAGYRHRSSTFIGWDTDLDFVDGIPFTATLGVNIGPVLAMLQVDGIKNVREDEITRENLSVGVGIFASVWRGLAIEGRFAGEVWANNAAQGISFGVGLSWRLPYPGGTESRKSGEAPPAAASDDG